MAAAIDTSIKGVDGFGIRMTPDGDEYELVVMYGGAAHVVQKFKKGRIERFVAREAARAKAAAAAAPPAA
jgi:hypothetical protein